MYKNTQAAADPKAARHAAILDAISRESIGTQNDLVKALRRRGISVTQVSVSRDVAELGIVKAAGRYRTVSADGASQSDPEMPLRVWVRTVASAGPNMVVVRCDTGTAQRVGIVIDGLALEGVVGTLAGDDTVFIAVTGAEANKRMSEFLNSRIKH
jgi:transcriptional regulator of arginine metabolism